MIEKMCGSVVAVALSVALCVSLAGCSSGGSSGDGSSAASDEAVSSDEAVTEDEAVTDEAVTDEAVTEDEGVSEEVDYDLTSMGSDMVYATVNEMMTSPSDYEGKRIRMTGTYSVNYYEPTESYYHFCYIADASACCSSGIEFVWDDGSHAYPDEYPEVDDEITVEGVFETYTEAGDDTLYCHLRDATLEVA